MLRAPEKEGVKGGLLQSAFALLLQQLEGRGWGWWGRVTGAQWDLNRILSVDQWLQL